MSRSLIVLVLITCCASLHAAPYKPPTDTERQMLALFNKAWGGDEASFNELRRLADSGVAYAENAVGNFHAEGKFVPADEAVALQWWTRAAEQGLAVGQYNVAKARQRAMRKMNDMVVVNEWLLKAAEQGFLEAQLDIAVSYTMKGEKWFDPVQAYKWFTIGAANALAQGSRGQEDELAIFAYNNLTKFSKKMTKAQIAEAEKLSRAWLDEYGIDADRERSDLDAFLARQKASRPAGS
jgi:TPR repeat protein